MEWGHCTASRALGSDQDKIMQSDYVNLFGPELLRKNRFGKNNVVIMSTCRNLSQKICKNIGFFTL